MKLSKNFWRSLLFVILIAALCGAMAVPLLSPVKAAPRMAISPGDIVISEFRFRGSGGASDEFVEIYNRTGGAINLNGWKLKGSNASGATSTRFTISTDVLLESGQYYLFANIPTVDGVNANAVYGTGITADGGAAITLPDDTIVDEVGVSVGSAFVEGTNLSSFPSDADLSYERNLGGASGNCVDSGDNSADYLPLATSQPQNLSSPIIYCPGLETFTPTSSATITGTSTETPTTTITPTVSTSPAPTNTVLSPATDIVISEFRTVGPSGGNDEFIELYNPSSSAIVIGDWIINRSTGCGTSITTMVTINSGVTLLAGQHYLIGGTSYSGSVTPDQPNESLGIANNGGIALLDSTNAIIDQVGLCSTTLYLEGTALIQLTTNSNRGYDRKASPTGICVDSDNNAADFFLRSPSDPQNSSSVLTNCGNPTPTPTITSTPTVTRTPTKPPTASRTPTSAPAQLVAINEFVPRPGRDWNNDGLINTGDEFIELINHGTISVNISGWTLDDEANLGSSPYVLPSRVIQPGERIVLYGSVTGLLLSDGGDGVRLLKPNGALIDAFNYPVVNYPDQGFCRLPDNGGLDDWNRNCYPTPGLPNSLGSAPGSSSGADAPFCPIADTLPLEFYLAECTPFGNNIWSRFYWDNTGWYGEMTLPEYPGKWPVFVD